MHDLDALQQSPVFAEIFSGDITIPLDHVSVALSGESPPPREYVHSETEKSRIAALISVMAKPGALQVVSDVSGTVSPFVKNHDLSAIDDTCLNALIRLKSTPGAEVVFLTGREPEVLVSMLAPKTMVQFDPTGSVITDEKERSDIRDSFGRTVLPQEDQSLHFPIIGNHGAVSLRPPATTEAGHDKGVKMVPPMTEEELSFVEESFAIGRKLLTKYPALELQFKENSGVYINAAHINAGQKQQVIAEAREALQALVDNAAGVHNPLRGETPAFTLMNESAFSTCIAHQKFNKEWSLTGYGFIEQENPTFFLCDDFNPAGQDSRVAAYINSEFPKGFVIQVLNGRESCLPESASAPNAPLVTFANPAQLGRFLKAVAYTREQINGPCI